jgi:hypothetical protein
VFHVTQPSVRVDFRNAAEEFSDNPRSAAPLFVKANMVGGPQPINPEIRVIYGAQRREDVAPEVFIKGVIWGQMA